MNLRYIKGRCEMRVYILIVVFGLVFMSACQNKKETGVEDNTTISSTEKVGVGMVLGTASVPQTSHPTRVKNILFAHGYHDTSDAWTEFVNYMDVATADHNYTAWKAYRTDISKSGSIAQRAGELADYINGLDIENDSLLVVAHSMGGLDTHYIISMGHSHSFLDGHDFAKAAKRIHKVYTLATPHRGNMFSGSLKDLAVYDMGIENMRKFNAKYPYSTYSIDGRKIPLLAFRFHCGDSDISDGNTSYHGGNSTDGTVAVARQILFGAPHTQSIFKGRHTTKFPNECSTDIIETKENHILKGILDNKKYYTDSYDVVFYEQKECKGEENSFHSSALDLGSQQCGLGSSCSNDKIASVEIYPGVKENTTIELYDSLSFSKKEDWMRIHVGKTKLKEPYCINNLEHNSDEKNISVIYYVHNGLNGKVSAFNIERSNLKSDVDMAFYENLDCKGSTNGYFNFKESNNSGGVQCGVSGECSNDKSSSMKIFPGIDANLTISLFDDSNFGTKDDWFRIHIGDVNLSKPFCINGFEHDTSERENKVGITTSYYSNNGLNGKVSSFKYDNSSQKYGPIDIVVHEDENCKGDIVSEYNSHKTHHDECGSGVGCSNDTAKSVRLYPGTKNNITITLYNSKKHEDKYGYTVIKTGDKVLKDSICIDNLNSNHTYSVGVTKEYHKHTNTCLVNCGLSGHVSYIKIE